MQYRRTHAIGLVLGLAIGLEGCGGPTAKTPAQTVKADQVTQDAMRKYYGNMIGKKGQTRPNAKGSSKR
jgi:hypothetical protein